MDPRIRNAAAVLGLAMAAGTVFQVASAQAPQAMGSAATAARPTAKVLPFEQLERMAAREVPYITEIEIKDLLMEVEGRDAQGLKIELLMDRRDGQVLSRKVKYPKHAQRAPYPPAPAPAR